MQWFRFTQLLMLSVGPRERSRKSQFGISGYDSKENRQKSLASTVLSGQIEWIAWSGRKLFLNQRFSGPGIPAVDGGNTRKFHARRSDSSSLGSGRHMNLLDRLLGHDAWTTRQLLAICGELSDGALDREHDIGHGTLRMTLDHIICNMEVWSSLMAKDDVNGSNRDRTVPGMLRRLSVAEERLKKVALRTELCNSWDELWTDTLDNPPRRKTFGTAIAHVITHSMHHRAQVLYMLRRSGVESLPEGDVFSWEAAVEP